ncbi:oxidoreductase [Salmonella enterica subsp. enterica]|nr:oxidoreductase [Salmonella enterica subsp. enterica]
MKVLVTGATSGLGRNAVEFLRNKGISVRATGRNEAMGKLLEKMGAEFVHADLTELVSSQAKVMLAGSTRCGTAPALPRPGEPTGFRSGECSRHPPSGRMGGRLGRAQFYSYLLSLALF